MEDKIMTAINVVPDSLVKLAPGDTVIAGAVCVVCDDGTLKPVRPSLMPMVNMINENIHKGVYLIKKMTK